MISNTCSGALRIIDVSIILPVFNSGQWLQECLKSVICQDFAGSLELSVFNDASYIFLCYCDHLMHVGITYKRERKGFHFKALSSATAIQFDNSKVILEEFSSEIQKAGIKYTLTHSTSTEPQGVGFAKNRAVEQSCGKFLCFLDSLKALLPFKMTTARIGAKDYFLDSTKNPPKKISHLLKPFQTNTWTVCGLDDDVMHECRIKKQYSTCISSNNTIVGCCFHRAPEGSTPRYTEWANSLTPHQLYTQIYTAFGPTIVMPTWFCNREVFQKVGGFSEKGKGTPEDLLFFYKHLRNEGRLLKLEEDLLLYRYHPAATTFSVTEETVWNIRMEELERNVLSQWTSFTIWNAGKQGRKFYRCLSPESKLKVKAFCDVDEKKLAKGVYIYEESKSLPKPRIPIVHFTEAKPPFILCIKINMTGGNFERNLSSLNLREGYDYYHFS